MTRELRRVAWVGYYSDSFPRNAVLRHGLEEAGLEVVECRLPAHLAPGHSTGPGMAGLSRDRVRHELSLVLRALRRSAYVVRALARLPRDVDAVVVAEFNQGLVPLVAAFAARRRLPVALDFLISLWDTSVNSRQALGRRRPRAVLRWLADRLGLGLADVVLFDTRPQADYYVDLFRAERSRARVVPLGAAEWRIAQTPLPAHGDRPLLVLFYGSFSPLHGVEWILGAARRLAGDARFAFRLVGTGQQRAELERRYEAEPSGNVEFRAPKQGDIGRLIAKADICLGVFGAVDVAARVVPNKVWECLAAGRPVVTAGGPGPAEFFEHERHLLLVPPADAGALAAALDRLARDPELAARLAAEGAGLVRSDYSSLALGRQLEDVLRSAREDVGARDGRRSSRASR